MNPAQNKWLVAVALALFAYIAVTELRRPGTPPPAQTDESIAPRLRPATVTRIEFTRSNLTLRAELTAGQWRLTAPANYPADSLLLRTLADVCSRLRPQIVIPPEKVTSLADFGLQPPQATLIFQQSDAPIELRIGARTPVNPQLYVQVAGSKHVAVTDASLLEFLPLVATDWRDRRLLPLAGARFDRLRVRTGARELLLRHEPAGWRIQQPAPVKRANGALITHLLVELAKWPVAQFVTDDPRADLETFGLAQPESEIAFGTGTNDTLVVQFGRSPTNQPGMVFARSLAVTNVMLVPTELLTQLRAPVWEFSEHRLVDALPADAFDTIELRGRDSFTLRRQAVGTNFIWQADDSLKTVADPQLMQNFLLNLETLEARELEKEVVTDFASYGLSTGARTLSLLRSGTNSAGAPTNRLVARLDFGVVTNLPPDRLFARRHDESAVYVIPRGDVDKLPWELWKLQDRTVWNFNSNQVTAVTASFDGASRRLARAADGRWSDGGQPLDELRNVALEETLFRLGQLRAAEWVHLGAERLPIYGIGETSLRVSIELTGPPRTNIVTLGFIPRGRNPWAAVTDSRSGKPLVFEFPRSLYSDYLVPYLAPAR